MQRLYTIIKAIPDANTVSVGLGDQGNSLVTTGNIGGQSVVLPKAGQFNFGDIQNYVRSQVQDPYLKRENAKLKSARFFYDRILPQAMTCFMAIKTGKASMMALDAEQF